MMPVVASAAIRRTYGIGAPGEQVSLRTSYGVRAMNHEPGDVVEPAVRRSPPADARTRRAPEGFPRAGRRWRQERSLETVARTCAILHF
jgi:hypothetical protein